MDIKNISLIIKEILLDKYIKDKTIDDDQILGESGLDSIMSIELIVDLENRFEFEFEEEMINYQTLRSVNSLAKYIYEHIHLTEK